MKQSDQTQPKALKTALIQRACGADPDTNRKELAKAIRQAAQSGARLVVLQELHDSLYFCQVEDTGNFALAAPIPGPVTDAYAEIAAANQVVLVCSLFEQRAPGLYHNTAAVFDSDGRLAGTYRKMHIPDDPGFYEKFYFAPGDGTFLPAQTSLGKLGVLVCWDQWYPEAARLMAMAGADMLIYPTAIGWNPADSKDEQRRQFDAWQLIQRSHAVANGLPVLAVNRRGHEADPSGQTGGIAFWGGSFVAGPQGEILAQASHDRDETLLVDLDLERSAAVRQIWPYFRDRRIDAYQDLCRRWRD